MGNNGKHSQVKKHVCVCLYERERESAPLHSTAPSIDSGDGLYSSILPGLWFFSSAQILLFPHITYPEHCDTFLSLFLFFFFSPLSFPMIVRVLLTSDSLCLVQRF